MSKRTLKNKRLSSKRTASIESIAPMATADANNGNIQRPTSHRFLHVLCSLILCVGFTSLVSVGGPHNSRVASTPSLRQASTNGALSHEDDNDDADDNTVSVFDASAYGTYQDCRASLQEIFLRPNITEWIHHDVPILLDVMKIDGVNHVQLTVIPKIHSNFEWAEASWTCHSSTNNQTTKGAVVSFRKKRENESRNDIIVKCSASDVDALLVSNSTNTIRYNTHQMQACENRRQHVQVVAPQESETKQRLLAEDSAAGDSSPTRAAPALKIGACTMIAFQKNQLALLEWVEYHRLIGVQHFWVYINEPWSWTDLPLRDYITYVPWDYRLSYYMDSYEKWIRHPFQPAQMNNCVYNAKESMDWVTMIDTDEFIHVTMKDDNENDSQNKKNSNNDALVRLLEKSGTEAVNFNSIPFGANLNKLQKPADNSNYNNNNNDASAIDATSTKSELLVDNVWRANKSLGSYKRDRYKNVVQPRKTWNLSVHWVFFGPRPRPLNPETEGHLQHYKTPEEGVFQADQSDIMQDTTMRDEFRDDLLQALGIEEDNARTV